MDKKYAKPQNAKHRLLNLERGTIYPRLYFCTNIAYDISAKGSDMMGQFEQLDQMLTAQEVILSILVYTFFSRMFDLMLPPVAKHSIVVA